MRSAENNPSPTELFAGATNPSQSQRWLSARFGASRLLSIAMHALLVCLALIPWASGPAIRPKPSETSVMLYLPSDIFLQPSSLPQRSGGGGGGGKNQPRAASRGELPPPADEQFVPPDPEPPKNLDPSLVMIPTIVAPQLQLRTLSLLNIGDPNGVVGPPSSGPGRGGGIGPGDGRGDGDGDGPGAITGSRGGCCEGTYSIGGGVTAPVIVHRVEPEYSEEARKARYQGSVVLQAIVRKDGKVDVVNLVRSLGFGLDQNAIEALKQWRFRPATKDGMPVDVTLNIEVRFNIR